MLYLTSSRSRGLRVLKITYVLNPDYKAKARRFEFIIHTFCFKIRTSSVPND
jgi:hypothetical protein